MENIVVRPLHKSVVGTHLGAVCCAFHPVSYRTLSLVSGLPCNCSMTKGQDKLLYEEMEKAGTGLRRKEINKGYEKSRD